MREIAHPLPGLVAFGQVADDRSNLQLIAVHPGRQRKIDRELRSILPLTLDLQGLAREAALTSRQHPRNPCLVHIATFERDDPRQRQAQGLDAGEAEHAFRRGVPEGYLAGLVGADDRIGRGGCHLHGGTSGDVQAPSLKMIHHDFCQALKNPLFAAGQRRTRLGVDDADGAEPVPSRRDDRRSGIKTDEGLPGDERVVGEASVGTSVRDDQNVVAHQSMSTERYVARSLGRRETHAGFEKLLVLLDEAHERRGDVEDIGRQSDNVVELSFGDRAAQAVAPQGCEALLLIG